MQTEMLEEFLVVARYSSFRKAAEVLHVTQPALSKHIAALERELGFKLFTREGATHLTPAGSLFFTGVQDTLGRLSSHIEEARALAHQAPPARVQCLGKEDSVLYRFIASVSTPYVVVPMDDASTLESLLDSGESDVLVIPEGANDHLAQASAHELAFVAIGKAGSSYVAERDNPALAGGLGLTSDMLAHLELLVPFGNLYSWIEPSSPVTKRIGAAKKCVQDPSVMLDSDHAPIHGLGNRLMANYRGAAHRAQERYPHLVSLDTLDGYPMVCEEYLVYDPANPNPNVQAFVEEVRALAAAAREGEGSGEP